MFSNIGPGEVLVIVIVLLILFGGKSLPDLAKGLGQSSKEISKVKKEINQALSDISNSEDEESENSSIKNTKGVKPVMPNIGLNEVIIIAIILIVIFGSKALPNFIRGIAKAIREFRHASQQSDK